MNARPCTPAELYPSLPLWPRPQFEVPCKLKVVYVSVIAFSSTIYSCHTCTGPRCNDFIDIVHPSVTVMVDWAIKPISFLYWLTKLKWNYWHIFCLHKNQNVFVLFFSSHYINKIFQSLHDYNLHWILPIHNSFDDHDQCDSHIGEKLVMTLTLFKITCLKSKIAHYVFFIAS